MHCKSSSTDLSANQVRQRHCLPKTCSLRQAIGIDKKKSARRQLSNRCKGSINMMRMNQSDHARVLSNCKWKPLIVVLITLNLASFCTLAFNFNYQPELPQSNQHQQSLSPQTFNGLNQNTFYKPPANQFVPGQQFFNNQAFGQTVQLKPQQQIGGGPQFLMAPPPSTPNVDVSEIAGQLDEPQRGDYTNSYSLDTTPQASVFTETNRIQSMGDNLAPSSPAPPTTVTTTRKPSEQIATSQSPTTMPMAKRQLTPVEHQEAGADHELVQSVPSPSGKILDVAKWDSSVVSAVSTAPITREQLASSSTTTSTTTTTTPAPSTAPVNQQRHVLKPVRHNGGATLNNKEPLKRAEQQIIEQHARAGLSSGQVNRQRLEQTTSVPQYLLPNSYRDSGNKLVGSLLSTLLNYNSQSTSVGGGQDGGDLSSSKLSSSSLSNSASGTDRTKAADGLMSSLTSNFRSGISSRTSIVKAMGDNKLARTLSTIGKTIGGNKYVAGAGIAAALAALGLTVGKLMSPYAMMGSSYEKLGGSSFDQLTSGSMIQPTLYDQTAGRPTYFYPGVEPTIPLGAGQSQYSIDSMVAAANTLAGYESEAYNPNFYNHQASSLPVPSNWQQQIASFKPTRPLSQTTISPFVESANGHYSSYYMNQPNSEQLASSGDSYAQSSQPIGTLSSINYDQQSHQFLQPQRYGSYVSGVPSQSAPAYSSPIAANNHFYFNQDYGQRPQTVPFDSSNSGLGSVSLNADQITASASSDTPTFPDQPQLMQTNAANSKHLITQGNQRRLGTVSLKFDDWERNLLKQQTELLKRSRQKSDRFVVASGDNQSTRSPSVGQQHFMTSTSSSRATLDLGSGGSGSRSEWSGLNDSMGSWNTNSVVSSGNDLKVGQAKQLKQQFATRYPMAQTINSDSSQPIRRVSLLQMQKNRGESTRAPAYLLIASSSNQTQWQVSGPTLEKRPLEWNQASRKLPQIVVDTTASAPAPPAQSNGWQSVEATRQQVEVTNAPEATKKSLPQEASEYDSPVAVATDDESEPGDETQSANDKSEALAGDKTTSLRRVTRFDSPDSSPAANLSAAAFSNPFEDFFTRHLKGFESSSASSSETKSGQSLGRPQDKSDAKGDEVEIGHSGGKYQIDADGNGGNSFESATTTSGAADGHRSGDKANKLIESMASPMADNGPTSVSLARPIVTGVGLAPATQHDHHNRQLNNQYHNHRPQSELSKPGDQLAQTDNDNVVVELMPATQERRADYEDNNNSNSGAGKQNAPVGGRRVVGQSDETETTNDKRRSFRGLVAGSIGAN